ncbi:hypothetical protein [Candidatus Tisiphia endosymbiont of Nemotelus uliginosus]|uniref:hypothetical protein n=1 Tax=Candidatus Tisiphia endosymbiont of Nemotelus uliginosus TaxID=3077926 RepID=UPI0035C8A545
MKVNSSLQTAAYGSSSEDLSLDSLPKLPSPVEFRKKSIEWWLSYKPVLLINNH